MARTQSGGRVSEIVNPGPPPITKGAKAMAAAAQQNGKRGGGGRGKSGSSSAGKGKGRGRGSRNPTPAQAKALAAARAAGARAARADIAKNGSKRGKGRGKGKGRGRGRSSRNGSRSLSARNPLSVGGFGAMLKQLGYGGAGAFTVSTLSMLVPIPLTSPFIIILVQGVLAWVTGWLGGKLFGRQNEETVRIGAFAYVAGNAINLFFPNLQQKILEYSPIKAAPRALPSPAAQTAANTQMMDTSPVERTPTLDSMIMTDQEVNNLSDISAGRGYGYMGDISAGRGFGYESNAYS